MKAPKLAFWSSKNGQPEPKLWTFEVYKQYRRLISIGITNASCTEKKKRYFAQSYPFSQILSHVVVTFWLTRLLYARLNSTSTWFTPRPILNSYCITAINIQWVTIYYCQLLTYMGTYWRCMHTQSHLTTCRLTGRWRTLKIYFSRSHEHHTPSAAI